MPHKTYDQPPSVYDLFMKHSKACVLVASPKGFTLVDGTLSVPMRSNDALRAHAQKYAHNR